MQFTKKQIERYSRQIILKKIGVLGQKKLLKSNVLIVGAGGLGSPAAIYLAAIGVGNIGIIDKDNVELSNLSRQIIFNTSDVKKSKSSSAIKKLKKINPNIKLKSFNKKLSENNINKIVKKYDLVLDGSDNFRTRFLINDCCLKNKKILISGAVSKFDGQVYTFNFLKKNSPCLRCFIPNMPSNPDIDNCEYEGVMGTLTGIIGTIQANEVAKEILGIGDTLCGYILIIDALKLSFRKVKLNKRSNCYCNEKK
ncbi:MAG TPA: HesA/MoeB/ThiF family protein [Candidatus Pelagibacter sp.]|jgi:adenylyltransferase/sulfurtransferase|nr:HesA/MoeB/ThiF family protein [Candidatus Pelagibacter sp.]